MTTTEPTPEAVEALDTLLAAHEYIVQFRGAVCICGFVPDVDRESVRTQQDYHREHVARAVLAAGYMKYEPEPELLCWCGSATKESFEMDVCVMDSNHMVRHDGETYWRESGS